jgi:hypothetical protein
MAIRIKSIRWLLMSGAAVALIAMVVGSLAIREGNSKSEAFTQEICNRIKVGMTEKEVHDIISQRKGPCTCQVSCSEDSSFYDKVTFRSEDGSTIFVTYGPDHLVSSTPIYQ